MRGQGWKHLATEAWAFVAIAAIAFLAGLLVGNSGDNNGSVTMMGTHQAGMMGNEGPAELEGGSSGGAAIFTSAGCGSCHTLEAGGTTAAVGPNLDESLAPDDTTEGIEEMIVDPNAEIVEGYSANVMPATYGQTLSAQEVHELAEFLVASTPAKP